MIEVASSICSLVGVGRRSESILKIIIVLYTTLSIIFIALTLFQFVTVCNAETKAF